MASVMIVDDSLFVRNNLDKLLSGRGYETITAANGREAVSSYSRHKPDVVLMDVTMPEKDGLQALAEIRQADPQSRIIMLTALSQPMAATRAIHLGARDFLAKPVTPSQLLSVLQKVLKEM